MVGTSEAVSKAQRREQSRQQVNKIFIEELGGYRIAEVTGPNKSALEWYCVGEGPSTTLVVVQRWSDGGWEYYLQGKTGKLDEIAKSVHAYLASGGVT